MSTDIRTFFEAEPLSPFKRIDHILNRLHSIGANTKIIESFQKIKDLLEKNQKKISSNSSLEKKEVFVDSTLTTILDELRTLSSQLNPSQPRKKKRKL